MGRRSVASHTRPGRVHPVQLAAAYAVLATASTVLMARIDGTLVSPLTVTVGGASHTIQPLLRNASTLLDFLCLNPLVLYFLQRGREGTRLVYDRHSIDVTFPPYHRYGLMVVSVGLAAVVVTLYYHGFMAGDFFDAVIYPGADGVPRVSSTGWVVGLWTTVFGAVFVYRTIAHFRYVLFISSLSEDEIPYQPLHFDRVGGLADYAKPLLSFLAAMFAGLVIFIVFFLYDDVLNTIDESHRMWAFAVYVIVSAFSFFLPLLRLHQLMAQRRGRYFTMLLSLTSEAEVGGREDADEVAQKPEAALVKAYLASLEKTREYRDLVETFPVWPLPTVQLASAMGTVMAALYPLGQRLIEDAGWRLF